MLEKCTVKKVKRGIAYVELSRNEKCEGCKLCAFNGKSKIVVPARCEQNVAVGDSVTVQMPTKFAGVGALLIYALPLVTVLLGAVIGLVIGGLTAQLVSSGAGLALGLILIIPVELLYRRKSGVLPVVISRNDISTDTQNTSNGEHYGT